jgi:hypothetical protein
MAHRDPSFVDIGANLLGAGLGVVFGFRWRRAPPALPLTRGLAVASAMLSLVLVFIVHRNAAYPPNNRGASETGILEGHWTLDKVEDRVVRDSSGHHLDGKLEGTAKPTAGMSGGAIVLGDSKDFVDVGRSTTLRLTGSMTISAWINPSVFPIDDAPIVSNHNGLGYQLDTTIDSGPRTIGFKLATPCGKLMARYGATPLVNNRWYFVAGVYDAAARTIDVYLDGTLDDGFLLGPVSGAQRPSRESVYFGRRGDDGKFGFAGAIEDVRIYSRALNEAEINSDMGPHRTKIEEPPAPPSPRTKTGSDAIPPALREAASAPCIGRSDRDDMLLPAVAATAGALAAAAFYGLAASAETLGPILSGLSAGGLLLLAASPLPGVGGWMILFAALVGAASVVAGRSS